MSSSLKTVRERENHATTKKFHWINHQPNPLYPPNQTCWGNQIVKDLTWPIPREKRQSWFPLSANFVLNWDLIDLNSIRRQLKSSGIAVSNPPCRCFEEDMSTKVLIDSVHETMLKELAKEFRATQQDLVEECIRVNYNIVFKKKRWKVFVSLNYWI